MKKEVKTIEYSLCRPNKQIKSWHILRKVDKTNIWYPVAYIHEPRKKDKDFNKIMEDLYGK